MFGTALRLQDCSGFASLYQVKLHIPHHQITAVSQLSFRVAPRLSSESTYLLVTSLYAKASTLQSNIITYKVTQHMTFRVHLVQASDQTSNIIASGVNGKCTRKHLSFRCCHD